MKKGNGMGVVFISKKGESATFLPIYILINYVCVCVCQFVLPLGVGVCVYDAMTYQTYGYHYRATSTTC